MNPRTILKDYLAMRRKLGFKLQKHEETLRGFLVSVQADLAKSSG